MTEPISNTAYWDARIEKALHGHLHHSIFRCPLDQWERIEAKQRKILAAIISSRDSILDAGCGYGRLLDLLPEWDGRYLGIDLTPRFIALAQERHPTREFIVGDLRKIDVPDTFEFAILISMRPMVKRNCGDEVWATIEAKLRRVSKHRLYLEYDEHAEGSIE